MIRIFSTSTRPTATIDIRMHTAQSAFSYIKLRVLLIYIRALRLIFSFLLWVRERVIDAGVCLLWVVLKCWPVYTHTMVQHWCVQY